MTFQHKPNSGSLGRNYKKREGSTEPEFKGSAMIDGVEYEIAAWVNQYKTGPNQGKQYFGLKFKPKQQQQQSGGSYSRQGGQQNAGQPQDDDVPF